MLKNLLRSKIPCYIAGCLFYGEGTNPKLQDNHLSSVHDCLFCTNPVLMLVNLDVWDFDISWPHILIPLFQPFVIDSDKWG
jgi:hypothetical protein